ncbi:MAG: hypothetical protein ACE5FW_02025, partial [Candidatus Aenigmatarchaeota archaeon]
MLWVYFTLLAILTWSVANIADKYLIIKHIRQPRIAIVFLAIMSLVAAGMVSLAVPVVLPSLFIVLLALGGGVLYVAS